MWGSRPGRKVLTTGREVNWELPPFSSLRPKGGEELQGARRWSSEIRVERLRLLVRGRIQAISNAVSKNHVGVDQTSFLLVPIGLPPGESEPVSDALRFDDESATGWFSFDIGKTATSV